MPKNNNRILTLAIVSFISVSLCANTHQVLAQSAATKTEQASCLIESESANTIPEMNDMKGGRPEGNREKSSPLVAAGKVTGKSMDKPEPVYSRSGGLPTINPGKPVGALTGKTVFLSPGHGWVYRYNDSQGAYVWETQRGNTWGIIEDHSNGEAVLNHLIQYLHNAGANVWPCRERDMNTNMVIIDNQDSSPSFSTTGTWAHGTWAGNWQGDDYQSNPVSSTETAVATYTPNIPESGYYCVYIWTPAGSNRSTDARIRVNHTGGTSPHIINMQQDGNTWRFLGRYYFNAGTDSVKGSLEISNQGSDTTKYVIADAVRFGGGMGDFDAGGGVSGKPRWEESGRYFAEFMGQPDVYDGFVWAMPQYAAWESESWEDSLYFSWHTNAYNGNGRGTHLYVYGPDGPGIPGSWDYRTPVAGSDTLGERILDHVVADIRAEWDPNWTDGRKYSAWFGELNPSNNDEMPSCLLEVAYHDNELDARAITDPRFRDIVARGIYQGIVDWWYYNHDGPSATPIAFNTKLPEPPTHLSVRNQGNNTLRVQWQAPLADSGNGFHGDPATGYLVCHSSDGFGFDDGVTTTNTYMDFTSLDTDSIHYFRIIATNQGGQSFPSITGGAMVASNGLAPILVVNGYDRLDRGVMCVEDDPNSTNNMLRERLELMNHYGYIRIFADSIEAANLPFDFSSNEAVIDESVLLPDYPMVIWQSGRESTTDKTFDVTEQYLIQSFLEDHAGQIFVSGSEIAWELDDQAAGTSFYNNYLKADFSSDDAGTYSVSTTSGSIFDGLGVFSFDDGTQIFDVAYPDVIIPEDTAVTALNYNGGIGGSAGIVFDKVFKVVNFGFPFEAITDVTVRQQIMSRILNFFELNPPPPPPFDYNKDGVVDLLDFYAFRYCLAGPGYKFPGNHDCLKWKMDADGDLDVDLQDFAAFQYYFTAP